jgi:acyl-CoA reductase-like NAD-dependent aldehyde dehydrogenase
MGQTRQAYTIREPLGVIGAITAWNAPTLIASWKLAPALAAGNAVVLKPAEDASLSTLHLAKLIEEAELPAGAVNVVPGLGGTAGAALVRNKGVDKVSFTGSPEVGREIAVQCAKEFRRVALELGGKSPQIVLGDADPAQVIPALAIGFFANQGEICAAGTRILVERPLYDTVVSGLADAARGVNVGNPFDPNVTMGALINERQMERVTGYIEKGRSEGAELVAGGDRAGDKGYFVAPTVFAGGGNGQSIAQDEIFGPVGLVLPVRCGRRGDRHRQRHPLRPGRLRVDARHLRGAPPRVEHPRRRRVDQRLGAAGRARAVGRRQDQRRRPRARVRRHRGEHRGEDGHDQVVAPAYWAVKPPSTERTDPVAKVERSPAR